MHVDFRDWLQIAYYWSRGLSNNHVEFELGVSNTTVTRWFRTFRELVMDSLLDDPQILGGEGVVVEIG